MHEFARQASEHLHNVKVSKRQRASFNHMLERRRDNDQIPLDLQIQTDSDSEDNDCNDATNSSRKHVLEEMMSTLDEPGKQSLFTVINIVMEGTYREASFTSPVQPNTPTVDKPPDTRQHVDTNAAPSAQPQEDIGDILERLVDDIENMDLTYEQILSRLPPTLANNFSDQLHKRQFEGILTIWTPWWIIDKANEKATEKANGKGDVKQHMYKTEPAAPLPALPKPQHLKVSIQFARQKASTHIINSLIDILCAYTTALRLANGDTTDIIHVAGDIIRLSSVLSHDMRYTSIEDACMDCMRRITETEKSHLIGVQALSDVVCVLGGKSDWVSRAVFDCQTILEGAAQMADSTGKQRALDRRLVKRQVRKMFFFVAWALGQESELLRKVEHGVMAYVEKECGRGEEVRVAKRVAQSVEDKKMGICSGIRVLE